MGRLSTYPRKYLGPTIPHLTFDLTDSAGGVVGSRIAFFTTLWTFCSRDEGNSGGFLFFTQRPAIRSQPNIEPQQPSPWHRLACTCRVVNFLSIPFVRAQKNHGKKIGAGNDCAHFRVAHHVVTHSVLCSSIPGLGKARYFWGKWFMHRFIWL